jgi:hypothetical protein
VARVQTHKGLSGSPKNPIQMPVGGGADTHAVLLVLASSHLTALQDPDKYIRGETSSSRLQRVFGAKLQPVHRDHPSHPSTVYLMCAVRRSAGCRWAWTGARRPAPALQWQSTSWCAEVALHLHLQLHKRLNFCGAPHPV